MQTYPDHTHTTVLIITGQRHYTAPARLPRELRFAGFKVALLAPSDAWAARTRYVELLGQLPQNTNDSRMLEACGAAASNTGASIVLPGDDAIVQLLMRFAVHVRDTPASPKVATFAALVEHSLGNPDLYATSIDKGRLTDAARAAGIGVPDGESVAGIADAVRVARAIGYPVVVRPTIGSSSIGVAVCANEAEVTKAIVALPAAPADRWPHVQAPALVQKYLTGERYNRAVVGWKGREIAGYTRSAVERYPTSLHAASVSQFVKYPALADASVAVTDLLGITGFVGTQFINDQHSGKPCLIEVNRRMVPATHCGRHAGVDLPAAFAAAVQGRPWDGPVDTAAGRQVRMALFPQEWQRDARSEHLITLPVDAPWDDPQLFATMLSSPR